jgi:predicted DNA-binding protein YlxM (UPF0122 family)
MTNDDFHDSPLAKAIRRRKQLQDTIRDSVQEIGKIEEWLKMYRSFSSGESEDIKGDNLQAATVGLAGGGHGNTQEVFETLVVSVLRDIGRPMRSPEIIDEFNKRRHPIPGNQVRTAWNRLWEAKTRGVLTSDPKFGYWIAGEPLSEKAKQAALVAGKRRSKTGVAATIKAAKGKKKGPGEVWGPEQIEAAERMLLAGKSRIEVAAALGGVSQATIGKHFPGGIEALKKKYPDVVIPKRTYPSRPGRKGHGRPPKFNLEQAREIAQMKEQGNSINEIAEAMGVKRTTIYKYLKKAAHAE